MEQEQGRTVDDYKFYGKRLIYKHRLQYVCQHPEGYYNLEKQIH